jgi:hypothetical protein
MRNSDQYVNQGVAQKSLDTGLKDGFQVQP